MAARACRTPWSAGGQTEARAWWGGCPQGGRGCVHGGVGAVHPPHHVHYPRPPWVHPTPPCTSLRLHVRGPRCTACPRRPLGSVRPFHCRVGSIYSGLAGRVPGPPGNQPEGSMTPPAGSGTWGSDRTRVPWSIRPPRVNSFRPASGRPGTGRPDKDSPNRFSFRS